MLRLATPRLLGAAIILALAAACTPASDQPSAEQALCDSLAAFGDSVQAIADISPDTASIEDIQAAGEAAQDAWDQVLTDAADVSSADDAAVDAAWSALASSITDIPTDVPVSMAKAGIEAAIAGVQSAYAEMRDGLGCA